MLMRFLTSRPTILTGERTDPYCDSSGALLVANAATVGATAGAANAASRIVSSAATTNLTVAKSSAGSLYGITLSSAAAYDVFLKVYNSAAAVVGTTTPRLTYRIPAGSYFVKDFSMGHYFDTGISYAFTLGAADNSTVAIAAGDVVHVAVEYA